MSSIYLTRSGPACPFSYLVNYEVAAVAAMEAGQGNELSLISPRPRSAGTPNHRINERMKMQKHEVLDWLHTAAKRNLFGKGSWPADDETKRTYWSLFERYLSTKVSKDTLRLTKFAREIDVDSLAAFIGIDSDFCLPALVWDQTAELDDLMDQLEDGGEDSNELVKRYLRGAYIRYCAAHRICPFRPTS